ncbi:hypothetical protein [Mycobacterium avium]|uniref:hypothetical protein n=1 Tax=Mycobacterium avium TaxID=1764 RepID=UPI003899D24F
MRWATGHWLSSSAADTSPRNAARETCWVLSRSRRRASPPPGANMSRVAAEITSGACRAPHMPMAVRPASGSRCLPTTGSDAPARLTASA